MLLKACLGLKKIKLDPNDKEDTVREKITSNLKGSDGNTVGFPALRSWRVRVNAEVPKPQRSTAH